MSSHLQDLASFVTASPSAYHAAAEVARRLEVAGFTRQRESEPWQANGQGFVVRDGAVIAWVPTPIRPASS
jgi:aspartyl aminopeptidase